MALSIGEEDKEGAKVEKEYVGAPLYKHDRMDDKTEDHKAWVRHSNS
jgi:hypothetical protein